MAKKLRQPADSGFMEPVERIIPSVDIKEDETTEHIPAVSKKEKKKSSSSEKLVQDADAVEPQAASDFAEAKTEDLITDF